MSERQTNAYFYEMGCLEAVETTVPIKVGLMESSQEALIAEFGKQFVGKASRAWSILLNQISYQALADLISATGSPSEGWTAFKRHYAPQVVVEKARLTQSWYSIRMKEDNPPTSIFRGVVYSGVGLVPMEWFFLILTLSNTLRAAFPCLWSAKERFARQGRVDVTSP